LDNITKIIDPIYNTINYSYDNLNRKISEINAEGGETKFTYDLVGRMTSLADPVGNKTTWWYNLLGRVSQERVINDHVPANMAQ
jgi:YD repeat-containing protein